MTQCPFRLTQKLVQGKWSIVILQNLRSGPVRFNELFRRIPQAQIAVLNRNLINLQANGLVQRKDFHETPFHVEYALTDLGHEFLKVIDAMEAFGKTYAAGKKVLQMESTKHAEIEQQIHNEMTRQGRRLLRLIVDEKEEKAAAHWVDNNARAGISLFCFDNGAPELIDENIQSMPARPNHSGHSMIDGPTEIDGTQNTETSRDAIRTLVLAMISGNMAALAGHFSDNIYINHNPEAWDGLDGLQKALKARQEKGITVRYEALKEVIADGNFAVSEMTGTTNGKPTVFMDLFRLENGKVREHWDVVELKETNE